MSEIETNAPAHNLVMVNGSTSHKSYAVFARKGNMLLCIKPYGVSDGDRSGVEGTTYIGLRLRAAPIGQTFAGEDKASGVVTSIGDHKQFEKPADAWPEIEWEKSSPDRASAGVGVFLRGNARKDPEALIAKFKDSDVLMDFANYLFGLAGEGATTVCTPRDLRRFLDAKLTPAIEQMIASVKVAQEFSAALNEQVGVFGFQGAILKKLHQKHMAGVAQSEHVEDKEDEGEDQGTDD